MSDKAKLKRYNGSAFTEVYPRTTHDQIVASGTRSSSTFLRGDGVWATPAASTNNFLTGVSGSGNGTVTFTRSGLSSLTWNAAHTHAISNVTGLQDALNAKLNLTGGTIANLFDNVSNSITFNTGEFYTGPYLRGTNQNLQRGYYTGVYTIWDSGNDGASSGLDADLLDGQHGAFYRNATNLAEGTVPTARLGSGTASSATFLRGDNTWATPAGSGANYSSASLYIKRIWSRPIATGNNFTLRYDAGTGTGTLVSTNVNWTGISLGYTPATTDQFMIEFSNNSGNTLEKGICIVGYGTFQSTAGMAVISYDAYDFVDGNGQLKIAKYFAQWQVSGSALNFRYGSKLVW